MQDVTNDQENIAKPEEAANNNIDDLEGAPIAPEVEQPSVETRVVELEAELSDIRDRLLRALAETENVRRRAQREREDASKYAVAGFAKDLLSVADNLRRALDSLPQSEVKDDRTRSLLEGVTATERELLNIFERHGIRRIDPKGERFDHNFHQAIFEAERSEQPSGTIVEVLQPGYLIHERLLRPAMVGVAKGGPQPAEPADPGAK
jgi:molecular chaperone GrpE